jgi:hypothetical protein
MIDPVEKLHSPPIGLIVEGEAEYHCYRSLVCRIINIPGLHVPIVNAGGIGNLVRHLDDQLNALVLSNHPYNVIISIDLRDVIRQHLYSDCAQLKLDLEAKANDWLSDAKNNIRLNPLPNRIAVVVHIQQFETWIISDVKNLRSLGITVDQIADVDSEITNPSDWLKEHMLPHYNLKNPKHAKMIISQLDPSVMMQNSRSFDKFSRETTLSYKCWCKECGIGDCL